MKTHLVLIPLTFTLSSFSILKVQNSKSSLTLNIGVRKMSIYSENFATLMNDEGSYITKQRARNFVDINVLFSKRLN